MVYKKSSRLAAMIKLANNVGEDLLNSLIKREVVLVRDSNGETPYQVIYDSSGKCIFDSRKNGALSYECFYELKSPRLFERYEAHKGFQNFYGLNQGHLEAYTRYVHSLNKKSEVKAQWPKALPFNYQDSY